MKKTKILSLLLSLSLFCSLIVPGTTAYAETGTAPGSGDNGMKISKTATANDDGTYTIKLEAFATGEKTTQTTDVPTDIVLVLDQSGSMKDPIGGYTYTAYQKDSGLFNTRNYYNDEYYPLRHNDGSKNLWYKLNDKEYVAVSVEQNMGYDAISDWNNGDYYSNRNNLYCLVNGEYKKVNVVKDWGSYKYYVDGEQIGSGSGSRYSPTFDNGYAPLYQSVKRYTYSYTLNEAKTVIEESVGDGNNPNTQFYSKGYSDKAGDSRLIALQNAATTFVNAVAAKAAGEDGNINTPGDNVNHRIAVVGFASGQYYRGQNYYYGNTEVFVGSNQYRYGDAAKGQYKNAFQDMNTSEGVSNVGASIKALSADGGTFTDLGLEMGNGIFAANPIEEGKTRNRVVIVFSDGVPGWSGYDPDVANQAITQASTAKNTYGATVYSIGIFPGADATSAGNANGSQTEKANWFMQHVSSNTEYPQAPSYYLSAGDAASLNSIFQQISSNIGGSSTTLDGNTVVKDIISPYFTLADGASADKIKIDTYRCTGKNGDTYTWSNTSDGNGGASATVEDDKVSVTGFDFSQNWCGTETDAQGTTVRGKKLVISFKVTPKEGFLGGNGVPTNTSAGIYKNADAKEPVMTFPVPTVNVPIKDVTVNAQDKNVYLLGNVTEDNCKTDATAKCNGVDLLNESEYTGANAWKAAYVNITTTVIKPDAALTADDKYTISVKVEPKPLESGIVPPTGTEATEKSDEKTASINVFKPELTFKDSEAYYGAEVPEYTDNPTKTEWTHGNTTDTSVNMTGDKPTLEITYTPEDGKIEGNKINTKQDIGVDATVKIQKTDITDKTKFLHTDCTGQTCTLPAGKELLIHVKTCKLSITKQGGADDESYVFDVYKDGNGNKYSEVTIWGNDTATLYELPVGTYTIKENEGWSWRYNADNGGSAALSEEEPDGSITCTNTKDKEQWLNGFSKVVRNIYGEKH